MPGLQGSPVDTQRAAQRLFQNLCWSMWINSKPWCSRLAMAGAAEPRAFFVTHIPTTVLRPAQIVFKCRSLACKSLKVRIEDTELGIAETRLPIPYPVIAILLERNRQRSTRVVVITEFKGTAGADFIRGLAQNIFIGWAHSKVSRRRPYRIRLALQRQIATDRTCEHLASSLSC